MKKWRSYGTDGQRPGNNGGYLCKIKGKARESIKILCKPMYKVIHTPKKFFQLEKVLIYVDLSGLSTLSTYLSHRI